MQATQQKFRGCLLVGAMAGAYHGESCLPKKWLHIENKDYIIQMADELYAMEQ